jgi:hypothetical protein
MPQSLQDPRLLQNADVTAVVQEERGRRNHQDAQGTVHPYHREIQRAQRGNPVAP